MKLPVFVWHLKNLFCVGVVRTLIVLISLPLAPHSFAARKEVKDATEFKNSRAIVVISSDPVDSHGQSLPIDRLSNLLDYLGMEENLRIQWQRAVKHAEDGDGIIYGMSRTRDREKIFHFSLPVQLRYVFLVTRSDKQFTFNTYADLHGKTIGIPRGIMFNNEFDALKDKLFTVENDGQNTIARINKLMFYRMDAALFSSPNKNPRFLERRLQDIREERGGTYPQFDHIDISVLP